MSEEKKKSSLIKDALILFAITLIAALALGAVYEITKEPIEKAGEQTRLAAAQAVFPNMTEMKPVEDKEELAERLIAGDAAFEGVSVTEINEAYNDSGKIGCILTMNSSKGYGGEISMIMGVSVNGTLNGIEFLSLSETAGLGMKAKEEAFMSQFSSVKTDSFSLEKKKIAGTTPVDAISSATVTTAAVTRMVNAGLKLANEINLRGGD